MKSKTFESVVRLLVAMSLAMSFYSTAFGQDSSSVEEQIPPRGGFGNVSIKTTPEKAIAYLGGVKLGFTPIDTSFQSGRHTLTIMLNGEEIVKERVNVWPDKTLEIEKSLKMPYGSVKLSTKPASANISIDGESVGSTSNGPMTIHRLESGTRIFKISKGKKSKEVKVDILPEETVEVFIDIEK